MSNTNSSVERWTCFTPQTIDTIVSETKATHVAVEARSGKTWPGSTLISYFEVQKDPTENAVFLWVYPTCCYGG